MMTDEHDMNQDKDVLAKYGIAYLPCHVCNRAVTRTTDSGCACRKEWTYSSHTFSEGTVVDYCGNPDRDQNGDWCRLRDENCASSPWGFCDERTVQFRLELRVSRELSLSFSSSSRQLVESDSLQVSSNVYPEKFISLSNDNGFLRKDRNVTLTNRSLSQASYPYRDLIQQKSNPKPLCLTFRFHKEHGVVMQPELGYGGILDREQYDSETIEEKFVMKVQGHPTKSTDKFLYLSELDHYLEERHKEKVEKSKNKMGGQLGVDQDSSNIATDVIQSIEKEKVYGLIGELGFVASTNDEHCLFNSHSLFMQFVSPEDKGSYVGHYSGRNGRKLRPDEFVVKPKNEKDDSEDILHSPELSIPRIGSRQWELRDVKTGHCVYATAGSSLRQDVKSLDKTTSSVENLDKTASSSGSSTAIDGSSAATTPSGTDTNTSGSVNHGDTGTIIDNGIVWHPVNHGDSSYPGYNAFLAPCNSHSGKIRIDQQVNGFSKWWFFDRSELYLQDNAIAYPGPSTFRGKLGIKYSEAVIKAINGNVGSGDASMSDPRVLADSNNFTSNYSNFMFFPAVFFPKDSSAKTDSSELTTYDLLPATFLTHSLLDGKICGIEDGRRPNYARRCLKEATIDYGVLFFILSSACIIFVGILVLRFLCRKSSCCRAMIAFIVLLFMKKILGKEDWRHPLWLYAPKKSTNALQRRIRRLARDPLEIDPLERDRLEIANNSANSVVANDSANANRANNTAENLSLARENSNVRDANENAQNANVSVHVSANRNGSTQNADVTANRNGSVQNGRRLSRITPLSPLHFESSSRYVASLGNPYIGDIIPEFGNDLGNTRGNNSMNSANGSGRSSPLNYCSCKSSCRKFHKIVCAFFKRFHKIVCGPFQLWKWFKEEVDDSIIIEQEIREEELFFTLNQKQEKMMSEYTMKITSKQMYLDSVRDPTSCDPTCCICLGKLRWEKEEKDKVKKTKTVKAFKTKTSNGKKPGVIDCKKGSGEDKQKNDEKKPVVDKGKSDGGKKTAFALKNNRQKKDTNPQTPAIIPGQILDLRTNNKPIVNPRHGVNILDLMDRKKVKSQKGEGNCIAEENANQKRVLALRYEEGCSKLNKLEDITTEMVTTSTSAETRRKESPFVKAWTQKGYAKNPSDYLRTIAQLSMPIYFSIANFKIDIKQNITQDIDISGENEEFASNDQKNVESSCTYDNSCSHDKRHNIVGKTALKSNSRSRTASPKNSDKKSDHSEQDGRLGKKNRRKFIGFRKGRKYKFSVTHQYIYLNPECENYIAESEHYDIHEGVGDLEDYIAHEGVDAQGEHCSEQENVCLECEDDLIIDHQVCMPALEGCLAQQQKEGKHEESLEKVIGSPQSVTSISSVKSITSVKSKYSQISSVASDVSFATSVASDVTSSVTSSIASSTITTTRGPRSVHCTVQEQLQAGNGLNANSSLEELHDSILNTMLKKRFSDIPKASVVQIRRCGHCFHERCLAKWIDKSKKCPLCNQEFMKEKELMAPTAWNRGDSTA